MSKVTAAFALFSSLAFTTANAPTFQLLIDLPSADLAATDARTTSISDSAPYLFAFNSLNQELSEEDALERFEVDEFYLPRINVELPELFDWSDLESTYLASDGATFPAQMNFALDHDRAGAFRFASLSFGGISGGSSGGMAIASAISASDTANASNGKGSADSSPAPTGNIGQEPEATRDELVADTTTPPTSIVDAVTPIISSPAFVESPIVTKEPVQVPTPGTYGLFALGLAGLRLAGRKKNRSG